MNEKPKSVEELTDLVNALDADLRKAEADEADAFAKMNPPHGGGSHPRALHFMALSWLAQVKLSYEAAGRELVAARKKIDEERAANKTEVAPLP
jgi:hypothetical protein